MGSGGVLPCVRRLLAELPRLSWSIRRTQKLGHYSGTPRECEHSVVEERRWSQRDFLFSSMRVFLNWLCKISGVGTFPWLVLTSGDGTLNCAGKAMVVECCCFTTAFLVFCMASFSLCSRHRRLFLCVTSCPLVSVAVVAACFVVAHLALEQCSCI